MPRLLAAALVGALLTASPAQALPSGFASHNGHDWRTSLNTVEKTATNSGCASASGRAGSLGTNGSTCANGGAANFSHFELDGTLVANACYQAVGGTQRCVYLHVPEPV